jgi:hypothetical protein
LLVIYKPGSEQLPFSKKGLFMKKIIFGIFAVACLVAIASAVTWTAPTAYPVSSQIAQTKIMHTITALSHADSTGLDSLNGQDTVTLFSMFSIDPTALYQVSTTDSVGTADSIKLECLYYDAAGVQMGQSTFDTVYAHTSTSKWFQNSMTGINKTVTGNYATIRAIKWISSKTALVWKAYLVKTQPVSGYQPYNMR